MNGSILMKLITIDHYQVHMTPMTLRRSLGQRSRSASSGHRNL